MQMPPCAKNESLLSASDFVIIRIFLFFGSCNAAYNPEQPQPTIQISVFIRYPSFLTVSIILFVKSIVKTMDLTVLPSLFIMSLFVKENKL